VGSATLPTFLYTKKDRDYISVLLLTLKLFKMNIEKQIEEILRSTLVIENKKGIKYAVEKLVKLINSNKSNTIAMRSLPLTEGACKTNVKNYSDSLMVAPPPPPKPKCKCLNVEGVNPLCSVHGNDV
jgi:hypothetical protein